MAIPWAKGLRGTQFTAPRASGSQGERSSVGRWNGWRHRNVSALNTGRRHTQNGEEAQSSGAHFPTHV